jgi:hypothetical protein
MIEQLGSGVFLLICGLALLVLTGFGYQQSRFYFQHDEERWPFILSALLSLYIAGFGLWVLATALLQLSGVNAC